MKIPRDYNTPVMAKAREAVIALAAAHVAAIAENDADDGTGVCTATFIGNVLIVSANGEEADVIADLLRDAEIAHPERAL